ncbi:hypothetical protein [Streptomyces sp. NBC_00439]|uniref:hypothetical protein n=1 Tax=Streptomyces sp. NBC_00439 TaxID=2903650 RepID=UPI002254AD3C|nr:hypothetical protein [Streptomyces sp. NBC_00439]MCX5098190.1 hypothetical protein [Streptomyces sp. NBC_00439]
MSDSSFVLDDAWERVVEARTQSDTSAEALALSLLAQALYEEGRSAEAWEFSGQGVDLTRTCVNSREILQSRFRALTARGAELEGAAGPRRYDRPAQERARWHRQLSSARHAYKEAYSALTELGDAPQELVEESRKHLTAGLSEQARRRVESPGEDRSSIYVGAARPSLSLPSLPAVPVGVEAVFAGFLAVKVLGPFLEEWAKKMGEQFGESTAQALGRIRLKRRSRAEREGGELEAVVPDTLTPTTLVIPRQLTDEARLSIIDLDPADDAVRGATLFWVARRGMWIPEQELEADESLRGWMVRYTWAVTESANGSPRYSYDRVNAQGEAFACAMRAYREAPYLDEVHIRRAYEEDWGDPVRPTAR